MSKVMIVCLLACLGGCTNQRDSGEINGSVEPTEIVELKGAFEALLCGENFTINSGTAGCKRAMCQLGKCVDGVLLEYAMSVEVGPRRH